MRESRGKGESRPLIKERTIWLSFLAGCIITPLLFAVAAVLSGGGHSLVPAILLFPFSALFGLALKGISDWPGIVLLVLQFPTYGIILGIGYLRSRFKLILVSVAALHSLAAVFGLVLY